MSYYSDSSVGSETEPDFDGDGVGAEEDTDSGTATGGTAAPGEQGGDTIDPDTGEFTGSGGGGGGSDPFDDDADDPTSMPSPPDPDRKAPAGKETVPDVDGSKTRLSGPQAPGNNTGGVKRETLDQGGDEGQSAFENPERDDPYRPDASSTGVEEGPTGAFGNARESSPRDQAVEQLQGQIDRQIPGVLAVETDEYNVRRTANGYRAVLTDRGYRDARASAAASGDVGNGVVGNDADVDGSVDPFSSTARNRRRRVEIAGAEAVVAAQDDARSAEAGQDAFAASGRSVPTTDQFDSAEAASDLVGSGTVARPPADVVAFPFANGRLRRAAARGRATARSSSRTGQQAREGGGSSGGVPALAVPVAAARGVDQAFGPDRAPEETSPDAGGEVVQDTVPLPDRREVAADLQALTGLPSRRELTGGANDAVEGSTGVRPRQTFERERRRARDASLTAAAEAAERAQERPVAAVTAGAPVAAAEPSPLGEAALLGGAVAGAVGIDLAQRIRERRDAPAAPGVTSSEIDVPAEDQRQSEVEVPQDGERAAGEIAAPDDPAVTQSELGVGQSGAFAEAELQTPRQDADRDPLGIRTAELIGRQEARQRQRVDRRRERRDATIPERFVPDEDVTIGRRFPNQERPDFGVRLPGEDVRDPTDPTFDQPDDLVEDVPAGTVAGSGASAGRLFPPIGRERPEQTADVGRNVDAVGRTGVEAGERTALDQQQRTALDQQQRTALDQRQRFATPQRLALDTPTRVSTTERFNTTPTVQTPTGFGSGTTGFNGGLDQPFDPDPGAIDTGGAGLNLGIDDEVFDTGVAQSVDEAFDDEGDDLFDFSEF